MKKFAISTLTILILTGINSVPVRAAEESVSSASVNYSLGESDLGTALVAVAAKNNVQIVVSSQLTQGHQTPGLKGRFTLAEALNRLLAGSGLGYTLLPNRNEITIYRLPENIKNQLGAVNVEGTLQGQPAGANGSTDVTATEGTHSYSTTDVSIGGKAPQSLKDITQSVSVLTQQQLNDQHVNDLNSAMATLPGVTTTQTSSNTQSYYSRGWQIGSVSVDGAPPLSIVNSNFSDGTRSSSLFDLSMYDHVELLRGSDSLNATGNSDPGGTINLVRKRPLDHNQVLVQASAGSWDDYRTSLDVTGPLNSNNSVRGRAVVTAQNNNYFYDTANQKKRLFYGVLEFDLTPSTVMRLGGSYEQTKALPWNFGLPRYENAADPSLPRNTSYALPWSRTNVSTENEFLQLNQKINGSWNLSANLNRQYQTQTAYTAALYGPLSLTGDDSQSLIDSGTTSRNTQWLANINLDGDFDILSLPQRVSFGSSYTQSLYHNRTDSSQDAFSSDLPIMNTPEPEWRKGKPIGSRFIQSSLVSKIDSVFLPFLPDLHFQSALRWDDFHYNNELNSDKQNTQTRFSVPTYALRYDFTQAVSVYGSYSDVYQFQPFQPTIDNKPLPPMTGSTREIGIRYNKGTVNSSLALYKSNKKNMSNPDYSLQECGSDKNEFCYITGGAQQSKGIDFEISGEPLPWWGINFGYTFNINKKTNFYDKSENTPLSSFTPKHQIKLWNNFNLTGNEWLNKTQLGLGITAQTKTSVVSTSCDYAAGTCDNLIADQGFYSIFSSRLGYDINQNWNAAINVNNIFDRRYYSSLGSVEGGNWYGEPRNFVLSIQGKF